MQITLLGMVLVPLSLLWVFQPVRLLQLSLFASIFAAAAALIFGGFGLQPGMVPALLFIGYVVLQYGLGMRYPGEGAAVRASFPLMLLLFYALLSAKLLPDAFAGHILVEPQRLDPLDPSMLVPLQFSFGNITQSLYLAINVFFTVAVATFMTRASIPYERIIAAYLFGGYVAVVLTFWQFANRVAGVPFPDDLLQSNPGWAIVSQAFGTVPRVQGPFTEPAGLAAYMSGVALCCLWLSLKGYRVMRPNLLLALAVVTTLLSTSTTGIVSLAIGLPITVMIASVGGAAGALGRIGKTIGSMALAGSIVLAPVFILKPSLLDSVSTVVQSTTNKGDSDSYRERSARDDGAIATLAPTFGLGVGWGSYRSSSFIPGLLANGGVFSAVMVMWLIVRLVRLGSRARAAAPGHPGQILVDGFTASLCCQLATAVLSVPMISGMDFFLQLGCVIGVLVRMLVDRGARAAGAPATRRTSLQRGRG